MDADLVCNHKKCRKPLHSGQAWVTSCSHMFCETDGEKLLVPERKCPACDHSLTGKLDIVRIELNPSEAYKSMVLCGQRPDVILDICSRATTFWMFQTRQESLYKDHLLNRFKEKCSKLEKFCNKMTSNFQVESKSMCEEMNSLKAELEVSKKRCEELSDQIREKNFHLQKVQKSYAAAQRSTLQKAASTSDFTAFHSAKNASKPTNNFNEFDLRFASRPQTPPQRDNSKLFDANPFSFHASVPCSPLQLRNLLDQAPRHDEGISRKLF